MSSERKRIVKEVFHKSKEVAQEQSSIVSENNPEISPDLLKMFPPDKLKRIKAKSLRRYKRRQDIQWENYLESMNK